MFLELIPHILLAKSSVFSTRIRKISWVGKKRRKKRKKKRKEEERRRKKKGEWTKLSSMVNVLGRGKIKTLILFMKFE